MKKEIGLSTAARPKNYLTLENYMYMERQLWQSDGHEYVHEAYRVFISAKLKCHVFTPARLVKLVRGLLEEEPAKDCATRSVMYVYASADIHRIR